MERYFCYCIILDPAFQWLTDQTTGFATILPEASQWVDIIIKFELGFGIGFEMPLVVFYFAMFGWFRTKTARKLARGVCGTARFLCYGDSRRFACNHGSYVCGDGSSGMK